MKKIVSYDIFPKYKTYNLYQYLFLSFFSLLFIHSPPISYLLFLSISLFPIFLQTYFLFTPPYPSAPPLPPSLSPPAFIPSSPSQAPLSLFIYLNILFII